MGIGAVVKSTQVNRAITGATTVAASCYAIVTYNISSVTGAPTGTTGVHSGVQPSITVHFGPGASIPASYTLIAMVSSTGATNTVVYSLVSGVEFINSP